MTKKVIVTSFRSLGCTFVDWSIHFLSGQTHYYSVAANRNLQLTKNPITNINAHGHPKNHPSGFENTKKHIDKFNTLNSVELCSAYPVPMHVDKVLKQLSFSIVDLHIDQVMRKVDQYITEDYCKIFDLCNDTNSDIVYVSSDPRTILYYRNIRSLDRLMTKPTAAKSKDELLKEHQEVFFKSSLETWETLNLTNIWDVRERMALDTRPFNTQLMNNKFVCKHPHLWINDIDLWTRTVDVIQKIMNYLDLKIDRNRFQDWLPICSQWQKKQLDLLEFSYNQQHIVDSIVNDAYFEIDLTFDQEVIIQHCLIYQHGLNLKTWQLEKFPNNTRELHKLLEPNIHQVPKIY